MRTLIFLSFLAIVFFANSQTTTSFGYYSNLLNEERTIRIHLPKSFDEKSGKEYPLIFTLDGEYLFYAFLGPYEVAFIQGNIPEAIIVGIDQNYEDGNYFARWNDCSYDYKTGETEGKGILFRQFVVEELLPYLKNNYKVGKFKAIAGHSYTANYINYFLSEPEFSGFVAISPYIPESAEPHIRKDLQTRKQASYYFLSTGENDLSGHIPQIKRQDSTLFSVTGSPHFHYSFKNYPAENHFSLVNRSMSDALFQLFDGYLPLYSIPNGESLILDQKKDVLGFLRKRYEEMTEIYAISISVREDELAYVWGILEDNSDWTQLNDLGRYTIELYPESVYGYYMRGKAEESMNNLHESLMFYKTGYEKLGNDIMNKSDFYEDIERIEKQLKESKKQKK